MAWGVARAQLVAARDELTRHTHAGSRWTTLESLGRVHRWLDELVESREYFADAALDVIQSLEKPRKGDHSSRARRRIGGFLHLAGDHEGAQRWLRRSLRRIDDPRNRVEVHYLLGRYRAVLAGTHDETDALALLSRARLEHDPAAAVRARERFIGLIRRERLAPWEDEGQAPLSTWDWLEEAFVVEADANGLPLPSHREMLETAGLLARGTAPTPRRAPAGWRSRVDADDERAAAAVEVHDERWARITIDDSHEAPLFVDLVREGPDYRVDILESAQDSPDERIFGDRDFAESMRAAADWLDYDRPALAAAVRALAERVPATGAEDPLPPPATPARSAPGDWSDTLRYGNLEAVLTADATGDRVQISLREASRGHFGVELVRDHDGRYRIHAYDDEESQPIASAEGDWDFPVALELAADWVAADLGRGLFADALRALAARLPAG